MSFTSKVVVITGGSSGIGAVTAREFAKEGASLAITGRNKDKLSKSAEECTSAGAKQVLQIVADQRNLQDLENIIAKTVETFGQLDVLVNNAGGVFATGGLESVSMEAFDVTFDVVVKAHFYLTKLAVPHLEKTKGNVVNVSSMGTGLYAIDILPAMAKSSIDYFTKSAGLELAKKGIRVNAVNPAYVSTNVFRLHCSSEEENRKIFQETEKGHPLGGVNVAPEERSGFNGTVKIESILSLKEVKNTRRDIDQQVLETYSKSFFAELYKEAQLYFIKML